MVFRKLKQKIMTWITKKIMQRQMKKAGLQDKADPNHLFQMVEQMQQQALNQQKKGVKKSKKGKGKGEK